MHNDLSRIEALTLTKIFNNDPKQRLRTTNCSHCNEFNLICEYCGHIWRLNNLRILDMYKKRIRERYTKRTIALAILNSNSFTLRFKAFYGREKI